MTRSQFARARQAKDPGVLVHLVCNEADHHFYSNNPDVLCGPACMVLCVETFFSAMCEGGFVNWFDHDYCQLGHRCSEALREVGLPGYAALVEEAVRVHHQDELPTTVATWGEHLDRIRLQHGEEDCAHLYTELDTHFFAMFQEQPNEFRERLGEFIVRHQDDFVDEPAEAQAAAH